MPAQNKVRTNRKSPAAQRQRGLLANPKGNIRCKSAPNLKTGPSLAFCYHTLVDKSGYRLFYAVLGEMPAALQVECHLPLHFHFFGRAVCAIFGVIQTLHLRGFGVELSRYCGAQYIAYAHRAGR